MQTDLTDKVVIVTGASRGIGRAVALKLGQLGASVVVNYLNNGAQAEEVAAAINTNGGQAITVQADITNIAEIISLFDRTIVHFG